MRKATKEHNKDSFKSSFQLWSEWIDEATRAQEAKEARIRWSRRPIQQQEQKLRELITELRHYKLAMLEEISKARELANSAREKKEGMQLLLARYKETLEQNLKLLDALITEKANLKQSAEQEITAARLVGNEITTVELITINTTQEALNSKSFSSRQIQRTATNTLIELDRVILYAERISFDARELIHNADCLIEDIEDTLILNEKKSGRLTYDKCERFAEISNKIIPIKVNREDLESIDPSLARVEFMISIVLSELEANIVDLRKDIESFNTRLNLIISYQSLSFKK